MCDLFEIKSEVVVDGEHVFCKVCYVINSKYIVGDWCVWSLCGTVVLSFLGLIDRLERCCLIDFGIDVCLGDVFDSLNRAIWEDDFSILDRFAKNSVEARKCVAIPFGVESFDGEMAFCVKIDGEEAFVWRDFESKKIFSAKIKKKSLLAILGDWVSVAKNKGLS